MVKDMVIGTFPALFIQTSHRPRMFSRINSHSIMSQIW